MAKISTLHILVIALAIAFVFLFLTQSKSYVPYNNQPQTYSNYEPMTEIKNTPAPSEEHVNEESDEQKENFEPIINVPQTIHYGPFRDSEIIDKFSQITTNGMDGVDGCVSSGLSNAGGYICLTPELINLLKTRGGNASGGECLAKCSK